MIPFTAEVYDGLIAQYNAAIWPAQIIALLLGLAALALSARPRAGARRAGRHRLVAGILAAAWLWTAVAFHGLHFSALVWTAWGFAALFALQGLLVAVAAWRGSLRIEATPALAAGLGLVVGLLGLLLHPLAGLLAGQDWAGLRPVILAPAPLTLFTFGLLLRAAPRAPRHLLIVPILWSVIAGVLAWDLGLWVDLLLPAAAVVTVGVSLLSRR